MRKGKSDPRWQGGRGRDGGWGGGVLVARDQPGLQARGWWSRSKRPGGLLAVGGIPG